MSASASRILVSLALAGLVAVGATACGSESPTAGGGAPTAPSETQSPTASPTPSEAPEQVGIPVAIGCEQLITPEAMLAYNPAFSLNASYTPSVGSEAAEVAKLDGLTCAWGDRGSGAVIEVAVAQLPDEELTALKNSFVTESNSVPTYRVEGYFQLVDDTLGQADAFSGPYWITASSDVFLEPGDAEPIMAAAIAGLG